MTPSSSSQLKSLPGEINFSSWIIFKICSNGRLYF
ncbi:hypothetical protein vBEcoMWL3_gp197 [Escherichia phage vB_EcoM_WL-3]|nr:hypothetical protein vBEcoMWL3_gp197 [Escherichia phage vB_EcoM_WL-3]